MDDRYEGWVPSEPPKPKMTGKYRRTGEMQEKAVKLLSNFLESGDACWSKEYETNAYGHSRKAEIVRNSLSNTVKVRESPITVMQRGARVYLVREER